MTKESYETMIASFDAEKKECLKTLLLGTHAMQKISGETVERMLKVAFDGGLVAMALRHKQETKSDHSQN